MVGQALKGTSLVPLDKLEVDDVHSFGGCVVLEDAGRRYALPALLAPLSPRNRALVHAMIFGGLLFPPSMAPFYVQSHSARLAMFCGLDPEAERFDLEDLAAALRELDDRWQQIAALLAQPPHAEVRAVTLFNISDSAAGKKEMGAVGMDAEGIPAPLPAPEGGNGVTEPEAYLQQIAPHSKAGPPLLALDEEMAARLNATRLEKQPFLIELGPESLAALLRELNQAQVLNALREGGTADIRHQGKRYILASAGEARETQEGPMKMGSLKDLAAGEQVETDVSSKAGMAGMPEAGGLQAVTTNLSAERLPAAAALEWAGRARTTRAAFAPVHIVMGSMASGEGIITWRNHQNLQFLTHRLRSHLHAEWSARGETRPVEEVLRDLQELHRVTLTVDGTVARRLATHPSKAVAALLTKLNLWELFQTAQCGKK